MQNIFSFQYSEYHKTLPSDWSLEYGQLTDDSDVYPFRAYLAGYDNALEITLFQVDSDLDYICVEDIQGYSVSMSCYST